MERMYPSVEFEAAIAEDGTIRVPNPLMKRLADTTIVTVRLTKGTTPGNLRRRGVTEEEVEQIAEAQLEEREAVLHFLGSEGALHGDRAFGRRAAALLGKRK